MIKYYKLMVLLLVFSNMNSQTLSGEFHGDKTWVYENGDWSGVVYGVYAIPITLKEGAFKIRDYNFLKAMSEGKVSLANIDGYDSAEMKTPKYVETKMANGMKYIIYNGFLEFNSRQSNQSLFIKYSIIIKDEKVFALQIEPKGSKKAFMIRLILND